MLLFDVNIAKWIFLSVFIVLMELNIIELMKEMLYAVRCLKLIIELS